jgi:origin recognition complex subunit 2
MTYLEAVHSSRKSTQKETLADNGLLPSAAVLKERMDALPARGAELAELIAKNIDREEVVDQYEFLIEAGQSLLFYGLGSKIDVLDAVAEKLCDRLSAGRQVIVADGFCPTLTVRSLLVLVASVVIPRGQEYPRRHVLDYVRAISNVLLCNQGMRLDEECKKKRRSPESLASSVVIVIHNIDGVSLRSAEAQNVLSELARIPGVSLVASIDHVNAPLMWDLDMYDRFRWAWICKTTYARYTREMVFTSQPLLRGSEETRVEAAVVLLNSLSPNARKLFRMLAKMQLGDDADADADVGEQEGDAGDKSDSDNDASESGVEGGGRQYASTKRAKPPRKRAQVAAKSLVRRTTFLKLFERCRDEYLSSDPASVKSFLTELETHDMLDRRKGADAAEQLWIPLSEEQLRTVLANVDTSV